VVSLACLALWFAGIGTHEATPKIALVTDSSIESSTVHSVRLSDWERQWTRIADSLWDMDVKLSKERPVTVQLQVPTPTVTPASPTPESSRSPGRRKRPHWLWTVIPTGLTTLFANQKRPKRKVEIQNSGFCRACSCSMQTQLCLLNDPSDWALGVRTFSHRRAFDSWTLGLELL